MNNRYILLIVGLIFFGDVSAATYYVGKSGSDANSCATATSPTAGNRKLTITSGLGCLSAGDTLVIGDGSYAQSITNPPSGSAGNYITIRAENEGNVIVTGGLNTSSSTSYVVIQGLRFHDTLERSILGHHLKFLRNEFKGGPASGNVVQVGVGSGDGGSVMNTILFEDCWFHGAGGRYNLLFYLADSIVCRRCVIRHDGGWTDTKGDPEAATNTYSSSNIIHENSIILDSNLPNYHNWYGAFYSTADGAAPNNQWLGTISLHNLGVAYWSDPKSGGSLSSSVYRDIVAYDSEYGISLGSQGTASGSITRATIGDISQIGIGKWGSGSYTVNNSILFDITNGYTDGVTCSGCYTGASRPSYLLYLPRVESGTIGADIRNKIGVSGTLYGETGYDTTTADSLWPFPNEARIKKEMCTDVGVTRGFCSDTSLTHYIMNQLGNGDPYGGGDTTPPVISNPLPSGVQPVDTTSVTLSVSTNELATCRYGLSDVAYASLPNTFSTTGGTTHQQPGFSTSNGQAYLIYVRCIDGASNANTSSTLISFSVAADVTPPLINSRVVASNGTSLTLSLSENVSIGAGGSGGFSIARSSGVGTTVTYVSGAGSSTLVYSLSPSIKAGENVTLTYVQPGNGLEDTAGNDLANFSGASVTNNSTQQYSITTSAGANGSIGSSTSANYNATVGISVTANTGYTATVGGTCGGSPDSGTGTFTYTTSAVTVDCTVSATFSDQTPPTAPASLTATAVSTSQIDLSWGASTDGVGIVGYNIERCQGAGCSGFAQIHATSGTGTSYSDNTGLSPNTLYRYRVRARDAVQFGGYSPIAQDTTLPPTEFTVTCVVISGSGTCTPGSQQVSTGDTTTVLVSPSANYSASVTSACGSAAGASSEFIYSTIAIVSDCVINVIFSQIYLLAPPNKLRLRWN